MMNSVPHLNEALGDCLCRMFRVNKTDEEVLRLVLGHRDDALWWEAQLLVQYEHQLL
jgi:hypothetical protein